MLDPTGAMQRGASQVTPKVGCSACVSGSDIPVVFLSLRPSEKNYVSKPLFLVLFP